MGSSVSNIVGQRRGVLCHVGVGHAVRLGGWRVPVDRAACVGRVNVRMMLAQENCTPAQTLVSPTHGAPRVDSGDDKRT